MASKTRLFSVHDSKLNTWMKVFEYEFVGEAERAWKDIVNSSDSVIAKHPEDFSLYQIAVFDRDSGQVIESGEPQLIATAKQVKASTLQPARS